MRRQLILAIAAPRLRAFLVRQLLMSWVNSCPLSGPTITRTQCYTMYSCIEWLRWYVPIQVDCKVDIPILEMKNDEKHNKSFESLCANNIAIIYLPLKWPVIIGL